MVKKKKTEKASADTFSVDGLVLVFVLVLVFGLGLGLRSWSSVGLEVGSARGLAGDGWRLRLGDPLLGSPATGLGGLDAEALVPLAGGACLAADVRGRGSLRSQVGGRGLLSESECCPDLDRHVC